MQWHDGIKKKKAIKISVALLVTQMTLTDFKMHHSNFNIVVVTAIQLIGSLISPVSRVHVVTFCAVLFHYQSRSLHAHYIHCGRIKQNECTGT